jgi:hypothetical protein
MFPWFTVIKYGIPFLIGAMIAGGAAWKIQGVRLDSCRSTEQACLSANAENTKAITALQADITKGNKTCQERIASKDSAIKRLRDIDNMRGKDDKKVDANSGDPILSELLRMWDNNKGAVR